MKGLKNMKYYVGIDLGGTNLKIALLDAEFKIIKKQILSTKDFDTKQKLIDALVEVGTLE